MVLDGLIVFYDWSASNGRDLIRALQDGAVEGVVGTTDDVERSAR